MHPTGAIDSDYPLYELIRVVDDESLHEPWRTALLVLLTLTPFLVMVWLFWFD